jgi:hypothetical protein
VNLTGGTNGRFEKRRENMPISEIRNGHVFVIVLHASRKVRIGFLLFHSGHGTNAKETQTSVRCSQGKEG